MDGDGAVASSSSSASSILLVELDGRVTNTSHDDDDNDIANPIRFSDKRIRYFKALHWVPKVSGLLSLLGSSYITYDILFRSKNNRRSPATTSRKKVHQKYNKQSTFHRLLLALSISDVISSLGFILGSTMVPKEIPDYFDSEAYKLYFPYAIYVSVI